MKPIECEEEESKIDAEILDAMEIDGEQDPEEEEAKHSEVNQIDSASDTESEENHRPRKKRKKLPEEEFFNFENDFDDPGSDDDANNIEREISNDILLWRAEQLTTAEKIKQKEFAKDPLNYWKRKIVKWDHNQLFVPLKSAQLHSLLTQKISKYPHLGALARRVFVIRPSQAPTESQFSLGRFEMDGRKHNISPERFRDVMYLSSRFRNER